MATLKVYGRNGEATGTVEVSDELIKEKPNFHILHEAIVMYEANCRSGTHATKTRGEVAGSRKKPWVQKGTGRARAGCRRSPIWRGGAIVHGPEPRDYYYRIPKQVLKKALKLAVSAKLKDDEVRIVDTLGCEKPKTKEMAKLLKNLGVERTCLVAIAQSDVNAYPAVRNIEGVDVIRVQDINAYEVLRHQHLVLSKEGFSLLMKRLGTD